MKRVLLLIGLFSVLSIPSYAGKATFGPFGLEYRKDASAYNSEYVGQKVMYIPKETPSYDDEKFPGEYNTVYEIVSIMGKGDKMTITLRKPGEKKKVKWKVSNGYQYYNYGRYAFTITSTHTIPLILVAKLNDERLKSVGSILQDTVTPCNYEVIDFKLLTKDSSIRPEPAYVLKNTSSGEIKEVLYSEKYKGKYHASLTKVDKPADETSRYGESAIIGEDGITKYSYSDNFIDILIFTTGTQFVFKLNNISDNSIKVIWDEAVFVDFEGGSDKIMHTGIKYSQKSESQTPSTIIKGASLSDIAVPVGNVRYSSILKEWVTDSMFPAESASDPGQIKLMIPIQVRDIVNEYIFVFDVKWHYDHPEFLI